MSCRASVRALPIAVLIVLAGVWAGSSGVTSAGATTLNVTDQADSADGSCDAHCSLREAVIAANANADASTIVVPAGTYVLSIDGIGEGASATGDLDVTTPVALFGAGPDATIIDGGEIDGVIFVDDTGSLDITGITITNGRSGQAAGGVFALGSLRLTNVHVVENNGFDAGATNADGGLGAEGPLTIVDSVIDRNTAEDDESVAGMWIGEGSVATITNSSISNNTAEGVFSAGAISTEGHVTLNNVVIDGNTANGDGSVAGLNAGGDAEVYLDRSLVTDNAGADNSIGGVRTENVMTITDSVIDGNSAGEGSTGGVWAASGRLEMHRVAVTANSVTNNSSGGIGVGEADVTLVNVTIIGNTAGNLATAGLGTLNGSTVDVQFATIANNVAAGPSATGGLASYGDLTISNSILDFGNMPLTCFQIEGSSEGGNFDVGTTCGFDETTDHENTDPMLADLANNGGFSMTQALEVGSPAIDAATGCPPPANDQRLIPRPQGPQCDSGAFEFGDVATTGRTWGDILCNVGVLGDDAGAVLAVAAGVSGAAQPSGSACPSPQGSVFVRYWFTSHPWGDVNCSGSVDAVDALHILRFAAGVALTPNSVCPHTGELIEIG